MLLCSSMRGKRAPPKTTILAIYRQHSKGLGIQTAETAVILDSARAFLCDTPLSLTTETALRRELGDDAAKAGWWIFAARNALQEMDKAEAGRFCFCRSVGTLCKTRPFSPASHSPPGQLAEAGRP
jgi:hypothetical protein